MSAINLDQLNLNELNALVPSITEEITRRKDACGQGYNTLCELVRAEFESSGLIKAIKLFKEITHCGLLDSKKQVESWVQNLKWYNADCHLCQPVSPNTELYHRTKLAAKEIYIHTCGNESMAATILVHILGYSIGNAQDIVSGWVTTEYWDNLV